jgi:hypothetical protein
LTSDQEAAGSNPAGGAFIDARCFHTKLKLP